MKFIDLDTLASSLRASRCCTAPNIPGEWYRGAEDQWAATVRGIAACIVATNVRFDDRAFMVACGLDDFAPPAHRKAV